MAKNALLNWVYGFALVILSVGSTAHAASDPQEMVQAVSAQLQSKLTQNRPVLAKNPDQLYALVEKTLMPIVDSERVARWVLGRHWRAATDDQRRRFIEGFKNLLIRSYANTMLEYADESIQFLPLNMPPNADDVLVRSELRPAGQPAIPIHYSLHLSNGEWKVYDVVVNGISLVTNYRATFDNKIRQEGLDALLSSLATLTPTTTLPSR